MESDDGFDAFSREIESDPLGVLLAKWQRDEFTRKLKRIPGVIEVIPSGSVARDTLIGPVHDVDLIAVFDESALPGYGPAPESARAAMTYLENKLLEQLHPLSGAEALIKGTEQRTHVVCYGGSGPYAEFIPSAPPVDMMPAVRKDPHLLGKSHLLVPELSEGGGKWIDVDPETFMREVEQRQREWKYFTDVIKMVKAWAEHEHLNMKTVAIEAMVLKYCPRPRMFETLSRGEAVARFFEAASKARITSLKDPARRREIDPSMNFGKLQRELKAGAGLARQAMDAEYAWKNRFQLMQEATHPDVFWRKLFGRDYPKARERYWRPAVIEPWFGKYTAERRVTPDQAWFDVPKPPGNGGPKHPDGPEPPGGPNPPDGPEPPDDLRPDTPLPPLRDLNEPGLNPDWHGDRTARKPGGPGATDGAGDARSQPRAGRHPEPASAESVTNLWTGVFRTAATVSVPLTFG
jgi:hypothetical protein